LRIQRFSLTFAATPNSADGATSMNPDSQNLNGMIAAFIGIYMVFIVVIMQTREDAVPDNP
jgi:hypothetical protein